MGSSADQIICRIENHDTGKLVTAQGGPVCVCAYIIALNDIIDYQAA